MAKADKGTPELQEKRHSGQLVLGGVEYLFERKVITERQRNAGRAYMCWHEAFHSKHKVSSSLGRMSASEPSGEDGVQHMRLLDLMAAEDWFSRVSNELRKRELQDGIPYARIVLMVCAYGWTNRMLQRDLRKRSSTVSKWIRLAFEELVEVVELFRRIHSAKNAVDGGKRIS